VLTDNLSFYCGYITLKSQESARGSEFFPLAIFLKLNIMLFSDTYEKF